MRLEYWHLLILIKILSEYQIVAILFRWHPPYVNVLYLKICDLALCFQTRIFRYLLRKRKPK